MGVSIASTGISRPTVANIVLANPAGILQYVYIFPLGTRRFAMQPRTNVDVYFAFETGKVPPAVGGDYGTMKAGAPYNEQDLNLLTLKLFFPGNISVYLSSPVAGTVVEIICWQ